MGKVGSFALTSLYLWFNSDDHVPAHFHAEKSGAWELRVFFLRDVSEMFEIKWKAGRGPTKRELRALSDLVRKHRIELLEEWQTKVNVKAPGPKGTI